LKRPAGREISNAVKDRDKGEQPGCHPERMEKKQD
jgi:hypothetical protein